MRIEDIINFDVLDNAGYKIPVAAAMKNSWLYVTCYCTEFQEIFGAHSMKFSMNDPFFTQVQTHPFAEQLQHELVKLIKNDHG